MGVRDVAILRKYHLSNILLKITLTSRPHAFFQIPSQILRILITYLLKAYIASETV